MKLAPLVLAVALGCAASAAQAADAQQPTVNLYIWGEYLAPDTLANFQKQTGIRVVADHFDSWKPPRPSCSPVAVATTWCSAPAST